jgi:hypothetical protein
MPASKRWCKSLDSLFLSFRRFTIIWRQMTCTECSKSTVTIKVRTVLQMYCIFTKFLAIVLSCHYRDFSALLTLLSFSSMPFSWILWMKRDINFISFDMVQVNWSGKIRSVSIDDFWWRDQNPLVHSFYFEQCKYKLYIKNLKHS